jgi:DNA repair protein RadC
MNMMIADESGSYRKACPREILQAARLVAHQVMPRGRALKSPDDSREFLRAKIGYLDYEAFALLWLDNRHRVIAFEELFRGTIDGAAVYPREVAKSGLEKNAAAVILAHNHPSGVAEPSQADIRITDKLKDALNLFDIRTLDHVIVTHDETCSFAERGLI